MKFQTETLPELAAFGHESESRKQQLQRNQQPTSSIETIVQLQALAGNGYLTAKSRCSVHEQLVVASFASNEYEDISAKVKTALEVCDGQSDAISQILFVSARARDEQALRVNNNRSLSRALENEAITSYDLSSTGNQQLSPAATLRVSAIILRRPKSEVTVSDLRMIFDRISAVASKKPAKDANLVSDLYQADKAVQIRLTELEAQKRKQHTVKSKSIHKKKAVKKAENAARSRPHGVRKVQRHKRHHVANSSAIPMPYCEHSTRHGRRLAGGRGCQRIAGVTFRGYSRNDPAVFLQYR